MADTTVKPAYPDTTSRSGYLSLGSAADYVGFSERTLRRYIAEGLVPAYRIGPRQLRLKRCDLDALMRPVPTAR
jgi:excisionase family DNA binding protein